ncbi:restriction system protein [Acidovorax sp. 106]|nr:restriction system protein [Acidovorax sp. 106]
MPWGDLSTPTAPTTAAHRLPAVAPYEENTLAHTRYSPLGRSKRQDRARRELQEKGWTACALGLGMLVVLPLLAGQTPVATAVVQGLRPVGWTVLAVGVLLLAVHYAVRAKSPRLHMAEQGGQAPAQRQQRQRRQRTHLQQVPRSAPQPEWASTLGSSWGADPGTVAPLTAEDNPAQPHAMAPQRTEPHLQRDAQPLAGDTAPAGSSGAGMADNGWSTAVFAAIEWRRFEAVCEALFAQAGFETRAQSHGADGGVDIWLHSRNSPGPAAVVQCKHWQSKPVGVREMREFFGVMASHQLKRGTYATTSTYTEAALEFARANSIHTLDGAGLLQLIARRTPAQQQALLQVAYEGEYWRPTCASCGIKMLERTRGSDGGKFWGCAHFPTCRRTLVKTGA